MAKLYRFTFPFVLFFVGFITNLIAQENRLGWAEVPVPRILSIALHEQDRSKLVVSFVAELSYQGADKAIVSMMDNQNRIIESKTIGRTSRQIKQIEFKPTQSGTYLFTVILYRNGESSSIVSSPVSYIFKLPLTTPDLEMLNQGNGNLLIRWKPVAEAEAYQINYQLKGDTSNLNEKSDDNISETELIKNQKDKDIEYILNGLQIGKSYIISLAILRGSEKVLTSPVTKTIRDRKEREWKFTWFGQSTREAVNSFNMIDNDAFVFQLRSCTYDDKTGEIIQKGGKFTSFHDGISFYYTVLNPKTENFELTATFHIDYINPIADGQEGFGLLALDSIGLHGVNSINNYTNSAGIIATKFEETIDGIKRTSKDTLGARFVTGISKEVLLLGDTGIAQKGSSIVKAFSYDQSNIIKKDDEYRITLKKTNTGYHAVYKKLYASEEEKNEYILYGTEKLQLLDPDHIYVGFAVARGCNVTVKDVEFIVTDVVADPPGLPEPPEVVPLFVKIDSPTTYTSEKYPFVFYANADGYLTIRDSQNKILIDKAAIKSFTDFSMNFKLKRGCNDYILQYNPDPTYKPGPQKVMGRFDKERQVYIENYDSYYLSFSVLYNNYKGRELYVSPEGTPFGKGTKADPLDLATAIYFVSPGQSIILKGGVYYPTQTLQIERGNNGTEKQPKILKPAQGERAVFDFKYSRAKGAGIVLWGSYWNIESIDIRNTPGDVKGLQISGHHNIIKDVATYECGDTGLQISGSSVDPKVKWPQNNLIINCLSYDNKDPASNNADGFAAKLTVGDGNRFIGCIAHNNIDDGWDLFSKIESGPIGSVIIESCVAYNNGFLSNGSGNGDGNGFKLGGDGIAVPHILKNSISFNNGSSGITSNSNPAVIIEKCTSYGNRGANLNLYGKGEGNRSFVVKNFLSLNGGIGDIFKEMPELSDPFNFFWNGAASVNSEGKQLPSNPFVSVNMSVNIGWDSHGKIDLHDFLKPNESVPLCVGARF